MKMEGYGLLFCAVSVLLVGLCFCENYHLTDNEIPKMGEHDTSAVHGQLLSILDRLTSLDERLNALDGRITALDQRIESSVGDVSDKMAELLRQSSSVSSKILQDLRGVCADLTSASDSATSQSVTTASPPVGGTPENPFSITRVTKTETEDAYKLKVEYEATTKPIVLLRLSSMVLTTALEGQEMGMTVVEVPKSSPGDDNSFIYLHFVFADLFFTAQFNLDDTHDTMDIPRLQLHVQQGNDITFKPGNQVELNVTFTIEGDLDSIVSEEPRQQILVRSDTEEDVLDRYTFFSPGGSESDKRSVWMDVVKFGGDKGNRFATAVINSTRQDPEGILDMFVDVRFNCSRNCLLQKLEVHRSVKFYREDHSGPFPEGFIGFIHDDFRPSISHFECIPEEAEGNQCYVYCEAAGSGPLISMDISRLDANDDINRTSDLTLFGSYWGFTQLVFDDARAADAGDFRCTARSQTKEITIDLSMAIVKPAKIDHELSTVTKFKNGSVLATCVATGEPAPNVTFTTADGLSPQHYDVTTTSLDNTTRIDVFIADHDVASTVYLFECQASNVVSYSGIYMDYYSVYVRDDI